MYTTIINKIGILLMILLSMDNWTKSTLASDDRPIIGILTEEFSYPLNKSHSGAYNSYIAASYVKFVEGAGARAVPIWIHKDKTYYEGILGQINGVLWPGGSTRFSSPNGYAVAGSMIYRIAKKMNKAGDYFPILGICLGFELLVYIEANNRETRKRCSSEKQVLPLVFENGYRQSRLFGNAPLDIVNILKKENVTINFHTYCVTKESLKKANLTEVFRVLSRNTDTEGKQFISSIEHIKFPFYGLQFHPEKNLYEWIENRNIPHTANATRISQYFANFFIDEARKNKHRFKNHDEEQRSLIYNYYPLYTGRNGSAFEQCYLFP